MMRRSFRLEVEPVESRSLLSGFAPAAVTPPVSLTLSADRSTIAPGQPVHLTLTVTDTGTQDVSFAVGPSGSGFYAVSKSKFVWRSNWGYQPMFVLLETLHPGQSYTLHSTWNGLANLSGARNPSGPVAIGDQLVVDGVVAKPIVVTVKPS
jgi:hypothetical protein